MVWRLCGIVSMSRYECGIVVGVCGIVTGVCAWRQQGKLPLDHVAGASKGQQGQRREGGWEITNFGSGKYKM